MVLAVWPADKLVLTPRFSSWNSIFILISSLFCWIWSNSSLKSLHILSKSRFCSFKCFSTSDPFDVSVVLNLTWWRLSLIAVMRFSCSVEDDSTLREVVNGGGSCDGDWDPRGCCCCCCGLRYTSNALLRDTVCRGGPPTISELAKLHRWEEFAEVPVILPAASRCIVVTLFSADTLDVNNEKQGKVAFRTQGTVYNMFENSWSVIRKLPSGHTTYDLLIIKILNHSPLYLKKDTANIEQRTNIDWLKQELSITRPMRSNCYNITEQRGSWWHRHLSIHR